ncbi:MAG: helix-hairpin-helix domain-containing protein, partial [Thermodesulfobacteriota bacterium]
KAAIRHFACKDAFDIEGLGEKLIEQLVDKGYVRSYADLFVLTPDRLRLLDRMGDKSSENLIAAIEKSKTIKMSRFIYALGIRHVGENVAAILSRRFNTIDRLSRTSLEMLSSIEGVGPVIARSIRAFFDNPKNLDAIASMTANGVLIHPDHQEMEGVFFGKVLVLTGTLRSMSRSEAKQAILREGGKVGSSITRRTDYLITGESPGSKLGQAREFGIAVLDETEFLKRLRRR